MGAAGVLELLFFLYELVNPFEHIIKRMPVGKAKRQDYFFILKSRGMPDMHAGGKVSSGDLSFEVVFCLGQLRRTFILEP